MAYNNNSSAVSDYLFYEIGVNLIPSNSVTKRPKGEWKHWQDAPMTSKLYEQQKQKGDFDDGYSIITGHLWRGPYQGKYLVCIDIDNHTGLEEFLSFYPDFNSQSDLSAKTMMVQHEDAKDERAHIYFVTSTPIPKRSGISGADKVGYKTVNVPAIEVKSDSSTCMVGPGSIHKNDDPYLIIGTKDIQVLNEEETKKLDDAVNRIYEKYSACLPANQIKSENRSTINHSILSEELRDAARSLTIDKEIPKISEGIRSNTLISFTRFLLNYHYNSKDLEILREFVFKVNKELCDPPLPVEEVENTWNQDLAYLQKDLANGVMKFFRNEIQINFDRDRLLEKIPDKKFAEFVINTAKKTIKREDSLIRLILYTGLSTFTNDPLNLGIIAPTSEGKTYAVTEAIKFLPKQDVWMIGNMSPKVLIRDRGIMVDQNNQPIKERILELNKRIKTEKDQDSKSELEEQRKALYENSKVLINLSNKILVFLEPPHPETWDILKPILSHDTFEIEHPYVYKTETKGQEVKHIVTRVGLPVYSVVPRMIQAGLCGLRFKVGFLSHLLT